MRDVSEEARRALLHRHGSFAIAYSVAFQPGLLYFGDEKGFLSYKKVGKTAFVLADPLAPTDRVEPLIDAFLAENKDVGFWQVSHGLATLLSRRGFLVNALGREPMVDLSAFSFAGPGRRSFRTAYNRLNAKGYSVTEAPVGSLDPKAVRAISEGWRSTRTTKRHELAFLVRPVVLADERDVRKFFLFDPHGRPVGFTFCDPVYENGEIAGYLSTTRRWLPDADPLSAYFMMRFIIERLQAEGVKRLHLGLSPFHRIEDDEFERNWLTRRAFRFVYKNEFINRFIYPVRSVSEHKDVYGGEAPQCYYAFNTLPALPRILKLMRACRII